jgi:hypothetical protein
MHLLYAIRFLPEVNCASLLEFQGGKATTAGKTSGLSELTWTMKCLQVAIQRLCLRMTTVVAAAVVVAALAVLAAVAAAVTAVTAPLTPFLEPPRHLLLLQNPHQYQPEGRQKTTI